MKSLERIVNIGSSTAGLQKWRYHPGQELGDNSGANTEGAGPGSASLIRKYVGCISDFLHNFLLQSFNRRKFSG